MGLSFSASFSREEPPTGVRLEEQDDHPVMREVRRKIKAVYPDMATGEVRELADCLTNWEKFKERYFSHLIHPAIVKSTEEAFQEAAEFPAGYRNVRDAACAEERLEAGVRRVHRLQMKLLLYELTDDIKNTEIAQIFSTILPNFKYGPFHVAVQIGNVILEWDESSLVIPRPAPVNKLQLSTSLRSPTPLFAANVHNTSGQPTPKSHCPVQSDTESMFTQQVNLLLDISEEKELMINELASLATKYNTKYHYGIFSNNCQHFVQDVLETLGINRQVDLFRGRLRQHAELLMKRGTHAQFEFNTHQQLDEYVRMSIEGMSPEDLQFCHCHYLLFHVWSQKFPLRHAWKCDPETCQLNVILDKLAEL